MKHLLTTLLAFALLGAAAPPPPVTYTSYAGQFDDFAARTGTMPPDRRVAGLKALFGRLMPGLYADKDQARLDRRIRKALAGFPSIRPAYREVERRFPGALSQAVAGFRTQFPDFVPPIPIYLVHDLGQRDGGSDYVGGRKVMLFGADLIATLHADDSLQPFLQHELFHLEHARHFEDCDQFWCSLWQEGLATYAASRMTPGATDHQLILDLPRPIRSDVDAHWGQALCLVAERFDSTRDDDIDTAFTGGAKPASLPSRFGYYVGLRIAQRAGQHRPLQRLARLDDRDA
ncbi:MAG: hypothetical protein WA840_18420, partial [Caulobacteraceae bacterium]